MYKIHRPIAWMAIIVLSAAAGCLADDEVTEINKIADFANDNLARATSIDERAHNETPQVDLIMGTAKSSPALARIYSCYDWGWDWRCLTYMYQSGSVVIKNIFPDRVRVHHQEWHSHCGWSGWTSGATELFLEPNQIIIIPFEMDSNPDPWLCRENFVFDCTIYNGSEHDCDLLVNVTWKE